MRSNLIFLIIASVLAAGTSALPVVSWSPFSYLPCYLHRYQNTGGWRHCTCFSSATLTCLPEVASLIDINSQPPDYKRNAAPVRDVRVLVQLH